MEKNLKDIFNKYKDILTESVGANIGNARMSDINDEADRQALVPTVAMFAHLILSNWHKGDKDYESFSESKTITVRGCFDDKGLKYEYKTPKIKKVCREVESYDDYLVPMDGYVTGDEVSINFWEIDKSTGEWIVCNSEVELKDMVDEDLMHLWKVLKNNIRDKNDKK